LVQVVSVNFPPLHFLDSGLLGALLGATAPNFRSCGRFPAFLL